MDLVITGIPDSITEAQFKEWCSMLIARSENQKANSIQAVKDAVKTAETNIDTFRKANGLEAKFEVKEEVI